MKLATLRDDSRDGRLIIVRRDNAWYAEAGDIAPTLQAALDDWDRCEPLLRERSEALDSGDLQGLDLDVSRLHAPLPRAYGWIDGSAYLNHVRLVRKARNADPPATLETDPLVYQGTSCSNLAPTDPIPHGADAWGVDFEAEVVVILGDTPQGTTAAEAHRYIRLVTICNDVSLRGLIPAERAEGFYRIERKMLAPCEWLSIEVFQQAHLIGDISHRHDGRAAARQLGRRGHGHQHRPGQSVGFWRRKVVWRR